ncbi:hypothetical protein TNCV_313951 [Trichonephila clavipes]|nr:hypothetical protein TNCV_313951 [Trichonephila clavipes]
MCPVIGCWIQVSRLSIGCPEIWLIELKLIKRGNFLVGAACNVDFCNTIDAYSQDVDGFHFANLGLRNQFGVLIYSLLEQARSQYAVLKRSEMKYEMEEHNDILKQWGVSPQVKLLRLPPVVNRKQKSSSPRKDIAVAKKQKTEDKNMFSLLGVEELPDNFGEDQNPLDTDMEQHQAEPPHHSLVAVRHLR